MNDYNLYLYNYILEEIKFNFHVVKNMVRWPKACVGCGLTQPDLLSRHDYEHKHSVWAGSSYGYGYRTDRYNVTTLGCDMWLCHECLKKSRIRYVVGIIITLISFIVSMSLFVFALDTEILFDEEGYGMFPFIMLLIWTIVSLCSVILWPIFRWNSSKHYHKVRKRGSGYSFTFKNMEYLKIFEYNNQGAIIKHQSWFP